MRQSKAPYTFSPLLAVISLIWPAGEHAFKSESCLSTLGTGVDHSTGTLQHEYSSVPQHASPRHFPSLTRKHKNTLSPGASPATSVTHASVSSEFSFYYLCDELRLFMGACFTLRGVYQSERLSESSFEQKQV